MRLGWDEIKRRAKAFSEKHADKSDERADAQLFVNDFFKIFGMSWRQIGRYERRVADVARKQRGYIDFFWPGQIIVEMKSLGKSLIAAEQQALDYIDGVHPTERPRYVLACDFQNWRLVDLEEKRELEFQLADLHRHIEAFAFIQGRKISFENQSSVTIKAAELMGKLHDALEASGYTGHDLEQFLVRLLFCLFADDTGIFQPKDIFLQLIENDMKPDGSNAGTVLGELFDVLDTPEGQRLAGTSAELDAFPYINGGLFRNRLRLAKFDGKMLTLLLDAARHDWAEVSPAIFGSLFQSVMDAKERRAKGAHYTTEANILKVIGPLFLDDLKAELAEIMGRRTGREKDLARFQEKLTRLTFLDPACGCGNFLVIAYREIRRLELEALRAQYGDQQIDAALLARVNVGQFYGIEYQEFPVRIAEVAMWMMDHIANNEINEAFRLNYARIPLSDTAHILHADALETDWSSLLPPDKCSYIIGNPPFVGKKEQTNIQKSQLRDVFKGTSGSGDLDYVCCWFELSSRYIAENPKIRVGLVSTNSITQGEQVAPLWGRLFSRYRVAIYFAHATFEWGSEASGSAHVHVVIIGLQHEMREGQKRIFEYANQAGEATEYLVSRISPYLFEGPPLFVQKARSPLSPRQQMQKGSEATDFGFLTVTAEALEELRGSRGFKESWLRLFLGGDEFINGGLRYCLWLTDAAPNELKACHAVIARIQAVAEGRRASSKARTKQWANYPSLFSENRQPKSRYLLVPKVSSQRREYIPVGFCEPDVIVSGSAQAIESADMFTFGIVTSRMHMAWMRTVGGRTKSDYQYSPSLVYNTFPWPDATPAQREKVEKLAQAVLDARAVHVTSSLADLYDPDTMPANLRKAHAALDAAVDRLYRAAPFASDRHRVEHLFGRYEALVNPLERIGAAKNKRVARKAAATDPA